MVSRVFSRPGQSQALLYKHLRHYSWWGSCRQVPGELGVPRWGRSTVSKMFCQGLGTQWVRCSTVGQSINPSLFPSTVVQFRAEFSYMRRRCDEYRIQRAVFTQNVLLHLTKIDGCLVQCIALWLCDTLFLSSAGCHTWCTVYRGEIQHYSTTLAQTLDSAPYTTY